MILTSKHKPVTFLLTAMFASIFLVVLWGGITVADHTIPECEAIPAGTPYLQECVIDANTNTEGGGNSTVTVGGSDLECGDGGVQLGVGVGGDGKDCVGEGDDNNPIFEYLGGIVSFLSVGVGVVVTAMIMVGGIQYAAAGGNPQAVEAAKSRITNAIIALVLYAFMVGILNFLVPGGVL